MGAESNSGLISAEMVVDMDIDTEPSRPRTSEATVAVTSPMDSGLTPQKWWIFLHKRRRANEHFSISDLDPRSS